MKRRSHRHLELAVLRGQVPLIGIGGLAKATRAAREQAAADHHVHGAIKRLKPEDWDRVESLAEALAAALGPLAELAGLDELRPFTVHIEALLRALERITISDDILWSGRAGEALATLLNGLSSEGHLHPACNFADAMLMLARQLRATAVALPTPDTARITILGLLEARLLRSNVVVLGGLNEGKWPAQSDPGPWMNRPMRDVLGMQMPERDIGMTAHDFAQALGADRVYVTWSERIGGAPAVPSRWVVTAQMLIMSGFRYRTPAS